MLENTLSSRVLSYLQRKSLNLDFTASGFIIVCSCVIVLFYQADNLIGAIGLRAFYFRPGFILSFAFLVTTLTLLTWYGVIPGWLSIGICLVICVSMLTFGILFGWFAGAFLPLVPSGLIVATLSICLVVWLCAKLHFARITLIFMRLMTIYLSLLMAIYLLQTASLPKYAEFDFRSHLPFKNHYYYLSLNWGWLGDPDILTLYQCNQFGLYCAEVYSVSDYFRNKTIQLVPEPPNNKLLIQIDGKLFYSYQPSE